MEKPTSVIAASVPAGNRVLRFHGTGTDSAAALLTDITRFRWASFDVTVPDEVRSGPDGCLELGWTERKLLRLYQDGTLLFRAAADEEFLGWGQPAREFSENPRLNPVAVVEVHASFAHLYQKVLEQLKTPPTEIQMRVELRNGVWNGTRLYLTRYHKDSLQRLADDQRWELQIDDASEEFTVEPAELQNNPDRTSYRLVKAFASFFDMPPHQIPFTREGPSGREVNLEEIKAL